MLSSVPAFPVLSAPHWETVIWAGVFDFKMQPSHKLFYR